MSIPGKLNTDGRGIPVRDDQNAGQTIRVEEYGIPFHLAAYGTPFRVEGAEPVEPSAPTARSAPSVQPSEGQAGDTFTIVPGTYDGFPAATIAGTLKLAGVDVLSRPNGLPFDYIPDADGALVWSEVATNSEGAAPEQTASATVAAADVAPTVTTPASISPASGPVGTVFTVTPAVYAGTAPISQAGTLTQAGATVATRSNGAAFTFTSTAEGALAWDGTGTNSAGSSGSTAGATVTAASADPMAQYYGTGAGQVPIRTKASSAVMSGANVQRVPNAAGAGSVFDLIAGTSDITLSGGALDLTPAQYLRFGASVNTAPNLMDTTVFIVANIRSTTVDQYFLGQGSPQTDVYLKAGGAQMVFRRRSEVTNQFEDVTISLSPAVTSGLRLYEISISTGGQISVTINGELRGSASHPGWPALVAWNFASGRNPVNANGLNALVHDVASLVLGGAHDANRVAIRSILNEQYVLGITPPPAALNYFAATRNTKPFYGPAVGPAAAYNAAGNQTVIAWQAYEGASPNRYTRLKAYDHNSKTWGREYSLGWGDIVNDDHGVPAVSVTSAGYILVVWGGHYDPIKYAISKVPNSVHGGWNQYALNNVEYNYWRPVPRSDGNVDLFVRGRDMAVPHMPLVYHKMDVSAASASMGPAQKVVDFGPDSRFYSGDTFRAADGKIWMVASRADYSDNWRKDVYVFRIDTDAKTVTTIGGTSHPWPLDLATANTFRVQVQNTDPAITGGIPAMAKDAAGRVHISYFIGQAAGRGGTQDISDQEVFHLIIGTDNIPGAPFKVADIDQRYEGPKCVPLSNGAMGIYYATLDDVRGGGVLRRVIPAGSSTPGAVETVYPYDPNRDPLSELFAVYDAHPDFRVAFGEASAGDQDADARPHRLFAHGDGGLVKQAGISPSPSLPAGTYFALDATNPANLAAQTNGTGAVSSDGDAVRYMRDISESGRHFVQAGSDGPGYFLNTDATERSLQFGYNNFTRSQVAFRRQSTPIVQAGHFSITLMMAPLRRVGTESVIVGLDQGGSNRSFLLMYLMPERTVRFAPIGFSSVNGPSGLWNPGEYGLVTLWGKGSSWSLRFNGAELFSAQNTLSSTSNDLVLGARSDLSTSFTEAGRWRRVIGRSGPVTQAQIEADEAWVKAKATP